MPGPLPQPGRQRRNRSVSRRVLRPPTRPIPPLPKHDPPWHYLTQQWWDGVWSSPMASTYLDSDVLELAMLAGLVDSFWHDPSPATLSEYRLQRKDFGLTPLDRRRLEWEVEPPAAAPEPPAPTPIHARTRKADPRLKLA